MEKFEKTLKIRLVFCVLGALAGVGLVAWLLLSGTALPLQQEGQAPDAQLRFGSFFLGFRTGISSGLALVCVIGAIRFFRAARSEALRQKLYIQETDERKQFVRRQAGDVYRLLSLPLLIVATIIAGNFNITVFYTLLATTLSLGLLTCGLKLLYLKVYLSNF